MRNHPLIVEFAKNALQAFRPALPIRPSEPFLSHCKQNFARLLASVVVWINARHSAAALLNSSERSMTTPRVLEKSGEA